MRGERVDPETLAAFLDGTLPADERQAVVEFLAKSGAAREGLVETMALLAGTSEVAPAPPAATGLRARWRAFRHSRRIAAGSPMATRLAWIVPAIAAVLAVVVWRGATATSDTWDLAASVARTGVSAAPFGGWGATRGAGPVLTREAMSFRAGVRSADLVRAYGARDWQGVAAVADSIVRTIEAGDVAAQLAVEVRFLAQQGSEASAREWSSLLRRVAAYAGDRGRYELGVWSEAARVAIDARHPTFFRPDGKGGRSLAGILETLEADASTLAFISRYQALVSAPDPSGAQWDSRRRELAALLDELGH